nr:MAG TPA: hypothetical protein [Caudoviricetes sp.]
MSKIDAETFYALQAENEKLRAELKNKVELVFQQAKELDRRNLFLQEQEAELEQAKRELDVAIDHIRGQCRCCKKYLTCPNRRGPHDNCWQWRGQKDK